MKIIEDYKLWRVVYLWCFGTQGKEEIVFSSKNEAQNYIKGKRVFDGLEGYEIQEPYYVKLETQRERKNFQRNLKTLLTNPQKYGIMNIQGKERNK